VWWLGCGLESRGIVIWYPEDSKRFALVQIFHLLCCPLSHILSWYAGLFPQEWSSQRINLTSHIQIVQKLKSKHSCTFTSSYAFEVWWLTMPVGNSTFGHVFVLEYSSICYLLCCTFSTRSSIYNSYSLLTDLQICQFCVVYVFSRFVDASLYPNSKVHLGHGLACWTCVYIDIDIQWNLDLSFP
jgi:hypothetical protein